MLSRSSQLNSDTAPLLTAQSSSHEPDQQGSYTRLSDTLRPKSVGPGRKLPTIPTTQTAVVDKMSSTGLGDKNVSIPRTLGDGGGYGPFFLEYSLTAEYQMMKKTKPSGLYVVPSALCPLVWNGVVFVRQGLYQDAVFRFSLHIPDTFPDGDCPTVVFNPPVFHPLVDALTGELDVQRSFSRWRRNYNRLWQVVHYVRKVFYKVETNSPTNTEAAILYEQDMETYKQRVQQTLALAQASLYDDPDPEDAHAIRFSRMEPDQVADKRSQMLKQWEAGDGTGGNESRSIQSLGMSWIAPGSGDIFTKDELGPLIK